MLPIPPPPRSGVMAFNGGFQFAALTPSITSVLSIFGSAAKGIYDPSDSNTITLATGVSAFADKSGNGNTLTQATGANQPAWGGRKMNGRNALEFDGLSDHLIAPAGLYGLSNGDNLFYLVYQSDNTGDTNQRFFHGADAGSSRYNAQIGAAYVNGVNNATGTNNVGPGRAWDANTHCAIFVRNGANQTFYHDGGSGFTNALAASFTMTSMVIGAINAGSNRFDGLLGDFGFISGAVTSNQINRLGRLLSQKWGCAWTNIS